jgi:hypothetical protein
MYYQIYKEVYFGKTYFSVGLNNTTKTPVCSIAHSKNKHMFVFICGGISVGVTNQCKIGIYSVGERILLLLEF